MRGFVNILLLFLAGANSNSQNFNDYYDFLKPDNVLQEEQFFYFDTDLLQALSIGEPNANIFISPLSIKTALTMILEGSANATEKEIKNALRLPDDKNLIRQQFRELLNNFENKKQGVTLKLGNRIFVSSKLTPIHNYTEILKYYYFSNVTKVNFMNSKQSVDTVNEWVEDETHGFIKSIADQGTFSPDTSIFIASALYFKGVWLKSFSEEGTKTSCFQLFNGNCQMTPMMEVVDIFKYDDVKKINAKVVELPYTGDEFSMVILLPNKQDGIHQLARDIRTSINEITDALTETEVHVTIPRFSIDYSTDLIKYLPSVNIKTISQPNADLSALTAQVEGKISKMLHKARIVVNEQGTVAAAVTGAAVIPLMGNIKPRFRANRPFLFFIRHKPTKTILFEGRVMVPEKAVKQPQNPTQPLQSPQQVNNNIYNSDMHVQRQQAHQPLQQQQGQQQKPLQQPFYENPTNFETSLSNNNKQPASQFRNPTNIQQQSSNFNKPLASQFRNPLNFEPLSPNNNNQFTSHFSSFPTQPNSQSSQHRSQPAQSQQYFPPNSNVNPQQTDSNRAPLNPTFIEKTQDEKIHFNGEDKKFL